MTPADKLYVQLLKISMGIDPFTSAGSRAYSCTLEKSVNAPITWDYAVGDDGIYVTDDGRAWMREYEKSREKSPPG